MIRRKIWAAATVALAVAGVAQGQTGSAPKATLGLPKPDAPGYIARGVAPNPGYPTFVPRNYTAPVPPTYSGGVTPAAGPAMPTGAVLPALNAENGSGVMAPAASMPPPVVPPAPATLVLPSAPLEMGVGTFASDQVVTPAPVTSGTIVPGPITSGPVVAGPAVGGTFVPGPVPTGTYVDGQFSGMMGYTEGPLPMAWASLEWLNWKLSGVTIPPLITTSPAGGSGTLDDAATRVVYGGWDIGTGSTDGYRFRAGIWLDSGVSGIDFGFFSLGNVREAFAISSTGDPGVFRPFFNTAINAEDAQLVAFIDPIIGPILSGKVAVLSDTELWGMDLNYRTGLWSGFGGRFDLLAGYKYLRLQDTLAIQSDLTVLGAAGVAPAGTTIFSGDRFKALNQFHGAQVGVAGEWNIGCMTFGVRGTLAAGCTLQRVEVDGASGSITPAGAVVRAPGGLYALPSNMGTHERNRFSIAPEIGLTLGYQVTNNIRAFAGYNCMYWTNVARAGEQINRYVNGTSIPDPLTGVAAPVGAPSPLFRFRDDAFFAHGWSLGIEFRW